MMRERTSVAEILNCAHRCSVNDENRGRKHELPRNNVGERSAEYNKAMSVKSRLPVESVNNISDYTEDFKCRN